MTAAPDLIAGYLDDLGAGLRVPVAEAELILAEAEDHLRETAAAGLAAGMTEAEAQRSAIFSFGPARSVARAHHRRAITAGGLAMAAWKLAGLVSVIIGAGGITGMEIFEYGLRTSPAGSDGLDPLVVVYAAMAAGGLVLLAVRRLARRGRPGRDLLSPGITAGFLLLASPALWIYGLLARSVSLDPAAPPDLSCTYSCNWSNGRVPLGADVGLALLVLVTYAAMATGILAWLAARRLARRGAHGRVRLAPRAAAGYFLLACAPLVALIVIRAYFVASQAVPLAPTISESWLTPVSQGSASAAPLVSGAIVTGCLTLALSFGIQAAVRRLRSRPGRRRARLLAVTVLASAGLASGCTGSPARPAATTPPSPATPASVVSGCLQPPASCYAPRLFQVAYGIQPLLAQGVDGRGETVTVLDPALPFTGASAGGQAPGQAPGQAAAGIRQDLAAFDSEFRLTAAQVNVVTGLGGGPSSAQATYAEVQDLEVIHAVAPGATLRVILAPATLQESAANATAGLLAGLRLAVSGTDVAVIGWSLGEHFFTKAQAAQLHSVLVGAQARHVTVIAGSGDNGAFSGTPFGGTAVTEVSLPASDPLVLAVGGTTLTANPVTGTYTSETAWNGHADTPTTIGASGGGLATGWGSPSAEVLVPLLAG
ncbi:MAG TPA: hypothetical protein VMU95_39375 [Trebonia sp.]|nr:hypothetical protein [Trebonia sp.]